MVASELTQYVVTGLLVGGVYALMSIGLALIFGVMRVVEQIFETIDRIRKNRRLTILLVEQRVVEALELCDRGYVLETGRVALEGAHDALLADPRIQRAYLGA